MTRSRGIRIWALCSVATAVTTACGPSPLDQAAADCTAALDGLWEGPAAGMPLTFNLRSDPRGLGCGLNGSWHWNALAGPIVVGSMVRGGASDSVYVDLWSPDPTCPLEGVGEPRFDGRLSNGSLVGYLTGGHRQFSSWDCADPSDTIMIFDSVDVVLRRTG